MADKISSRQHQILKLLLENKAGLSMDELAKALEISRNAVAQHFACLEKKGYLQLCALNKTAGRPVRSYTLTEAGINYFPKQYAWFSQLMLTDLKQSLGSVAFEAYLRKLALTLSQALLPQFADKEIPARLQLLLTVMNDLGFEAKQSENSAADNIAVIEASNCIYHDLAQKHAEMCEFDKTLISTLLATKIEHVTCMAKGDHICAFSIKNQP
jgi:predicted ArsR family transcriptional regulator